MVAGLFNHGLKINKWCRSPSIQQNSSLQNRSWCCIAQCKIKLDHRWRYRSQKQYYNKLQWTEYTVPDFHSIYPFLLFPIFYWLHHTSIACYVPINTLYPYPVFASKISIPSTTTSCYHFFIHISINVVVMLRSYTVFVLSIDYLNIFERTSFIQWIYVPNRLPQAKQVLIIFSPLLIFSNKLYDPYYRL